MVVITVLRSYVITGNSALILYLRNKINGMLPLKYRAYNIYTELGGQCLQTPRYLTGVSHRQTQYRLHYSNLPICFSNMMYHFEYDSVDPTTPINSLNPGYVIVILTK